MLWTVGALAVAGCAYKPGSFTYASEPFAGQRVTIGCLDLSIERRPDEIPGTLEHAAVLAYRFGNRCDRAVTIDLARATVIARTGDGAEHVLAPFDPTDDLRALPLDGRFAGGEAIAYPIAQPVAQVCVDAGTLHREPGAAARPPHWLCFASHELAEEPS